MSRKKITVATPDSPICEVFPRFVASQTAKEVSDKTISTYHAHFHCIGRHLDLSMPLCDLTKEDLEDMVLSMRQAGLAHNTISSYSRVLRTFLNWCGAEGYTNVKMPPMKDRETVKETYTDAELAALLHKPAKDGDFCEYRNWVIVNFLLNCGCRASTVRNIQNKDVDLAAKQVVFRHTKNGKIQVIPLCQLMVNILSDYMETRSGELGDYLFCSEYGEMLSENALREAIHRYNRKRGVQKTSLHLFRHTFARKFLIDCGGDAFTLQKLLGHSTLKMTKHYCAIFDADIAKNFDSLSPLARMYQQKERISRK